MSPLVLGHVLLAESKVDQDDVALAGQQNVFGLEIAVDNIARVQVLKCKDKLGSIEPSPRLRERAFVLHMKEELASIHEILDQIQLCGRLERKLKSDNEG